ncbi:MAG: phage tail protein [Ignavibacteria bacterium]|nr:phage tail protein [Ignavibacteria bacterium]
MKNLLTFTAVILLLLFQSKSFGQEAYIGDIKMVAYNFAPEFWLPCDGRLLQINQYMALYSLIGTTYGGDGFNTFALPDLRGRVPVGMGQGSGLTNRSMGSKDGSESVTLNANQMPQHTHPVYSDTNPGTTETPSEGTVPAKNSAGIPQYSTSANTTLSGGTAGGNQPHNNMPPYIVINYIICVEGIYPTRP